MTEPSKASVTLHSDGLATQVDATYDPATGVVDLDPESLDTAIQPFLDAAAEQDEADAAVVARFAAIADSDSDKELSMSDLMELFD